MSIRKGFSFLPKYINFNRYNNSPTTSFSFGDKIKNHPNKAYQNYKFTVWGATLDLEEGDKVTIEEIDDITVSYYNGKNYFNISGKVSITKQGEEEYIPDKIPEVYKPLPNAEETFTTISEEETVCPFDI